jgi:Carboxypeptidase regulatory-like domain
MVSALRCAWIHSLLALVVLSLCVGALAQGGTGELSGLVTDPTGAVVAGATVTLTNPATKEIRTTTTTAALYTFPALAVGPYSLELSPKGFKSVRVQDIVVSVGGATTRDVKLEVGAQGEQVMVEAGAQTLQTTESSISDLVDRRVWEQLLKGGNALGRRGSLTVHS